MKPIGKKIWYFILPTLFLAGGMFSVGTGHSEDEVWMSQMSENLTTLNLSAPPGLNFAGEKVPVKDFDVLERFEHQLVRNVYFHSSTIMNMKRANRYEKEMKAILKKEGIPEDFFYLAIAESSLTNAVSPAGARGFWQFMKATGLQFGLKINSEVDERYHPIKSTYAACKYLKSSYEKFGNWTLVAASYNMGMAGVSNAMNKQQVDNYYDLYLNSETAAYVFRILALKTILENPARYGFSIPQQQLFQPIQTKKVEVKENIPDLVKFALDNGTTYKMLKVMNAWLRDDHLMVSSGQSYYIEIPILENQNISELAAREDADTTSIADTTLIQKDSLITPTPVDSIDSGE